MIIMATLNMLAKHAFKVVQSKILFAKPHISVGSIKDLGIGGHWFDLRLRQYSFRKLMIVIVTGFIPLSLRSIVSTIVMWEGSYSGLERILCGLLVQRTPENHGRVHWPPRYNWNIVQNGVKHHTINQNSVVWYRFQPNNQMIPCISKPEEHDLKTMW